MFICAFKCILHVTPKVNKRILRIPCGTKLVNARTLEWLFRYCKNLG